MPYTNLLITAAVIALPFLGGAWLANRFRMPDYGWKIGLILFALAAGTAICATGGKPKLGIDLSGGVILVYEIKQGEQRGDEPVDMDKLIAALSRRVNPGGVREVTIRPYGEDQIEIIIPEVDAEEVTQIERKISSIGSLEFRITANRRDHEGIIEQARQSKARHVRSPQGDLLALWVPVAKEEAGQYRDGLDYAVRDGSRPGEVEVLCVTDSYNVNGGNLVSARSDADERGRPAVLFTFNPTGARLFGGLTGDNLPDQGQQFFRHLAILLDGYLQSAPSINSVIFDRGQITGDFTRERVDEIVSILNAGSLPTALEERPISRLTTGPTLGADMIRKGTVATGVSLAAVALFMAVYYRFSGLVACFALFTNLLLTVAVMIAIKAALTLPGLAGLVLTVGMAVDANVLIYERIREELQRGAQLRMAIRNGFSRAFSAIFDSNLTTLITAVVLYYIGTDQVKGFAVTLFLGISLSMFTAIFCARVVFEVAERMRWITKLNMMQMVRATNFDFVRQTPAWIALSLVVIGVGLAGVVMRGRNLLDIDFTGGVSVQLLFDKAQPQPIADVRRLVSEKLPDVAVSDVRVTGEPSGLRYLINSSERDLPKVERQLHEVFGAKLAYNRLTVEEVALIDANTTAPPGTAVESPQLNAPADSIPGATPPAENSPATPPSAPAPATPNTNTEGKTSALPAAQPRFLPGDDQLLAQADTAPAADQTPPAPAAEAPAEAPTSDAPAASEAATPEAAPATIPTESAPAAPTETPAATAAPSETPAAAPAPTTGAAPTATGTAAPTAQPRTSGGLFLGGTRTVLQFSEPINHDTLRDKLVSGEFAAMEFGLFHPDYVEGSSERFNRWEVRFAEAPDVVRPLLDKAAARISGEPYFPASTMIGGAVASSTQQQALYAMLASMVLMVVYIWVRFERLVFGVAAVIALVHDVLVTLGAVALSSYLAPALGPVLLIDPFKINLPLVAAFLTIVGYSINDTIVTFDRLREIRGKSPNLTADMVNQAINQTLSRTILTSLTVLMVVLILYVFGGQGIHGFAFALLVGCIAGVYSTVFIATPIVLWMLGRTGGAASSRSVPSPTTARQTVG